MSWLKRWWTRMRNYTSDGDYAGSHGSAGSGGSGARAKARFEGEVIRYKDSAGPTSSGS